MKRKINLEQRVDLTPSDYAENNAAIIKFDNDETLVAWHNANDSKGNHVIFGQRYDSYLDPIGTKMTLVTSAGDSEMPTDYDNVRLAKTNNGYVLAWLQKSRDSSSDRRSLFCQCYLKDGTFVNKKTLIFSIANNAAGATSLNDVTATDTGFVVLLIQSRYSNGNTYREFYVKEFDNQCNLLLTSPPYASTSQYGLSDAYILAFKNRNLATIWLQSRSSTKNLFLALLNSSLVIQKQIFLNNDYSSYFSNLNFPSLLTLLPNDRFLVSTAYHPTGVVFNSTADFIGSYQSGYAIASSVLSDGGYVMISVNQSLPSSPGFLQRFSANGLPHAIPFPITNKIVEINNGGKYAVTSLSNDTYIIIFQTQDTPSSVFIKAIQIVPVVNTNTLTLKEGEAVTLSDKNINIAAVDYNSTDITILVADVAHGRFELVSAPNATIQQFLQGLLYNGQVKFIHDGSENQPSYTIIGSKGRLQSLPAVADIRFMNVNDAPRLTVNQFAVSVGQPLVLSEKNLFIDDPDTPPNQIMITLTNIQNAKFELVQNPGATITRFTLQQVIDREVRLIPDGSMNSPLFDIGFTDGEFTFGPVLSTLKFDQTNRPPVVNKPIPDLLDAVVGRIFSFTVPENTFIDPDQDPLTYEARTESNDVLPSWINFDAGGRKFSGTPVNPGQSRFALFARDPRGGSANTTFSVQAQTAGELNTEDSFPVTALAAGLGGGLALILMVILGYFIAKKCRQQNAADGSSNNQELTVTNSTSQVQPQGYQNLSVAVANPSYDDREPHQNSGSYEQTFPAPPSVSSSDHYASEAEANYIFNTGGNKLAY